MNKTSAKNSDIILPVAIAAGGLLLTLLINHLLQKGTIPTWKIFSNEEVNFTFTMQTLVLANSLIVLGVMYYYDRKSFVLFFKKGSMMSWLPTGIVIATIFTLGTTAMMAGNVSAQGSSVNKHFFTLLPLVVLYAATNAWSEEIFSRFVLAAGLYGKLDPNTIANISAIIFGLAHYGGTPSGVFGIIAAGSMGWFLAKSVTETKGMGWALLIHFLQDLVIFGAGAMMITDV